MAKGHADYDGWILRLIEKGEDITFSYSMMDWLAFAKDKIEGYHGATLTDAQIDILSDKFNDGEIWQTIEDKTEIRIERPFRYKGQITLRDLNTGRFTSKEKVNQALSQLKTSRDMEVKTGKYVRERFKKRG